MSAQLKLTIDLAPLKRLQRKSPKAFDRAQRKAAVQFLNWANNGSKNSAKKPPIRWGVLRGSSSAFIGTQLVTTYSQPGIEGKPTPAKSPDGKPEDTTLTFAWNTDYAWKMHEWGQNEKEGWGEATKRDFDAGNKWLEEHLRVDAEDLMEFIRRQVLKELSL